MLKLKPEGLVEPCSFLMGQTVSFLFGSALKILWDMRPPCCCSPVAAHPYLLWPSALGLWAVLMSSDELIRTWVLGDRTVADSSPGVVDWMENYPQAYAAWLPDCLTNQDILCKILDLWLFWGDQKAQPHWLWDPTWATVSGRWVMTPLADRTHALWVTRDPLPRMLLATLTFILWGCAFYGHWHLKPEPPDLRRGALEGMCRI